MTDDSQSARRAVIDGLFEAALDPQLWQTGLERLSDYVGGSAVNLVVLDKAAERPVAEWFVRGDGDAYATYLADYFALDRRVPRVTRAPINTVLLEGDLLSEDEKRSDVVYNEILSGNGMRNMALMNLSADGQHMGLGLTPRDDATPFEADQVDRLAAVLPELRHALRFFNANRELELQRDSLARLWDHAGKGIAIFDRSLDLVFANALFEGFGRSGVLSIRGGSVFFADPHAEARRKAKMDWLRAGAPGRVTEFLAQHPATFDQYGVRLYSAPVVDRLVSGGGGPAIIMVVQSLADDVSIGQEEIDRFCQLFGITAAEGRVVGAIAAGIPLEAYAAGRGVATDTVRKQLKSAMAKSGVASQKMLISRIERFCFLTGA